MTGVLPSSTLVADEAWGTPGSADHAPGKTVGNPGTGRALPAMQSLAVIPHYATDQAA